MFGFGSSPRDAVYLPDLRTSETFSLPNRPSKDTNNFHKKAKQNSSELAEPRRLPTACFGLVRKQEIESYATQVVDSQPGIEDRGAQATQETKHKLNPFVDECEAFVDECLLLMNVNPFVDECEDTRDRIQRRHAF